MSCRRMDVDPDRSQAMRTRCITPYRLTEIRSHECDIEHQNNDTTTDPRRQTYTEKPKNVVEDAKKTNCAVGCMMCGIGVKTRPQDGTT